MRQDANPMIQRQVVFFLFQASDKQQQGHGQQRQPKNHQGAEPDTDSGIGQRL